MNRKDLLEMGLAFLVGSGLMFGIQKKVENEFRSALCEVYEVTTGIMDPIAGCIGDLKQKLPKQEPQQKIKIPDIYLVDSRKY
ncbi:MAG: hypothetical protein AABX29_09450 [Nanoarchaeota archaeon]